MHSPQCPPLPAGSIDFNALHNAARQGHDMDKAVVEALAKPDEAPDETVPAPVDPLDAAVPAETMAQREEEPADPDKTAKGGKPANGGK